MSDQDALLAAVLADPESDAPRLVLADWLEENGEPARAEFVRVQIDLQRFDCAPACVGFCKCEKHNWKRREVELWTTTVRPLFETNGLQAVIENGMMRDQLRDSRLIVRRGFVHTVRGSLAALRGVQCDECGGTGVVEGTVRGYDGVRDCYDCHGSGRTVGVLREIVRTQPVERVDAIPESDWLTDHGEDFIDDLRYAVSIPQDANDDPDSLWPAYMTGDIDEAREWMSDWLLNEARGVPLTGGTA